MKLSGHSPLRKLRIARDLSLDEVARAVGTFTGNLSRIEVGSQGASPKLAARLVEFFGKEITELHVLYPERYADWVPKSK